MLLENWPTSYNPRFFLTRWLSHVYATWTVADSLDFWSISWSIVISVSGSISFMRPSALLLRLLGGVSRCAPVYTPKIRLRSYHASAFRSEAAKLARDPRKHGNGSKEVLIIVRMTRRIPPKTTIIVCRWSLICLRRIRHSFYQNDLHCLIALYARWNIHIFTV